MVKLVSVLLCVCGLDGLPETFDHALPVRLVTLAQGILSEKQMIPETIASLVRNELLLSSSSESSELRERIDMEALRKLLFGLMVKSTYETHLVYAGFEDGTWMAYYNANDPVEGSYAFSNSSQCGSSFCGSTWRVENVTGSPVEYHSARTDYDCRTREWYRGGEINELGVTSVYSYFDGRLGFTGYARLVDSRGNFVGVAGWDYLLSDLGRLLSTFARDSKNTTVVLCDGNDKNLMASSSSPDFVHSGRIRAVDSPDLSTRRVALMAEKRGWRPDAVFIENHSFVHVSHLVFDDVALAEEWTVVVSYSLSCREGEHENETEFGCASCVRPSTSSSRSRSCDLCIPGYYRIRDENRCAKCPDHTDCVGFRETLENLPVSKGYMRTHSRSSDVVACIGSYDESQGGDKKVCPGGRDQEDVPCGKDSNREGPRCEVCRDGYFERYGRCFECARATFFRPGVVVVFVVTSLLVLLILYWLVQTALAESAETRRSNAYARLQAKIRTKWRIMFVAFQIIATMPDILDVPFPSFYVGILDTTLSVVTFQVDFLVPLRCMGRKEGGSGIASYEQIVLNTSFPFVLSLVTFFFVLCRRGRVVHLSRTFATIGILVAYCLYPTCSASILQIFRECEKYDAPDGDGTALYLSGDYAIRCETEAYRRFKIYCALLIPIWIVGVPLVFAVLLFQNRAKLDPVVESLGRRPRMDSDGTAAVAEAIELREDDASLSHIRILFMPYEPQFFLWEVVECVRRLVAISVTMFVAPGSYNQIFFAIFVTLASLKLIAQFKPFFEDSDDELFETLNWIVLFIQLIGLKLRISSSSSSSRQSPFSLALLLLILAGVLGSVVYLVRDAHRERKLLSMMHEDVKRNVISISSSKEKDGKKRRHRRRNNRTPSEMLEKKEEEGFEEENKEGEA